MKSTLPKRMIIIGAGGHARVVSSILNYTSSIEIVGFLDNVSTTRGECIGQHNVLGDHSLIPSLYEDNVRHAIVAIGNNQIRAEYFNGLTKQGFTLVNAIHPRALLETETKLGSGNVISMGALVCCNTRIGDNCIINTGAIIDHETQIDDHVHVAPGVKIAGRVHIKHHSFIGIGATIKDYITIGKNVTIGAGAVVVNDMPDNAVAVGVPAKPISFKAVTS